MTLGEAIEKRNYYLRCLDEVVAIIKQSSVANDEYTDTENKKRVNKLFKLFSEHYAMYQKFKLLVSRSESTIMLPLEDGVEVSIRDAKAVRESMEVRYNCYRNILDTLVSNSGSSVCVDIDEFSNILLNYHDELFGINTKIDSAAWRSEV